MLLCVDCKRQNGQMRAKIISPQKFLGLEVRPKNSPELILFPRGLDTFGQRQGSDQKELGRRRECPEPNSSPQFRFHIFDYLGTQQPLLSTRMCLLYFN